LNPPLSEQKPLPRYLAFLVLAIAVGTKAVLFYWGAQRFPFDLSPGDTPLSIWNRWDASHYLRIAGNGYSAHGLSVGHFQLLSHFPPLYPFFVAVLRFVSGAGTLEAGMFLSLSSGILAALLLACIAWREFENPHIVLRSSILFHLYPVSYFLITPYSESVFFVLIFVTFLLLRQRSGLLGTALSVSASIATRLLAAALLPVFVFKVIRARRKATETILALCLPLMTLLSYFMLNKLVWGDPLFFLQHVYTDPTIPRYPTFPLRETLSSLAELVQKIQAGYVETSFLENFGWGALMTAFALIVTLCGVFYRLLPWEYSLYSLVYLLFYSSFNWGISNARYSFGAFPIFLVLAQLRSRLLLWLLVLIFTSGLLYFSKRFVWGYWAF